MLFRYPINAITENWVHEALFSILQNTNDALQKKEEIPEWLLSVPEPYRKKITGKGAFGKLISKYQQAAAQLNPEELEQVSKALVEQNEIEQLLSNECNCSKLFDLPEMVQKPIKDLFEFGFDLLKRFGIRDRQYEIIYKAIPSHICPFCGLEYFVKPGMPREDLDHYLAEHIYTLAATNLSNLVPMGHDCNSKYKGQKDMLWDSDGNRRTAFYAYKAVGTQISLVNSKPFGGMQENGFPIPLWEIDFVPSTDEATTWDSVFSIRKRYKEDVLDDKFVKWIAEFGLWCVDKRPIQDIVSALGRYTELQILIKDIDMGDRLFLKVAMFEMLYHHCQLGDQRLITFMDKVANGKV